MRSALVTGVSTGIGAGIAATLIGARCRVFGTVRTQFDGEQARTRLGDSFEPLLMDITDEASVAKAARAVEGRLAGDVLDGLVNNAGFTLTHCLCKQRRIFAGKSRLAW